VLGVPLPNQILAGPSHPALPSLCERVVMGMPKKKQQESESQVPRPSDFVDEPKILLVDDLSPIFSDEAVAQVIEAAKVVSLDVDEPLVTPPNTAELHEVTKELYMELLRKMEIATKLLSQQNLQNSTWRKAVRERLQESRGAMRFLDI